MLGLDIETATSPLKYAQFMHEAPGAKPHIYSNEWGMPLPGPDFMRHAEELGGAPKFTAKKKNAPSKMEGSDGHLEELHYKALYMPRFTLPVKLKGRTVPATFIMGHRWGGAVHGPVPTKVMVIGKWPGRDEIRMQRNLVGSSSQLMMNALNEVGMPVEEYNDWYITNVVRFPNLDPSGDKFVKDWAKDCAPLLEAEMRLVRPDYILTLGSEAAKAVLGEAFQVSMAIGKVFTRAIPTGMHGEEPVFKDVQVVAALHPAFIIRQADRMPEFKASLRQFRSLLMGEDVDQMNKPEDVDHRIISSLRELRAVVNKAIAERKGAEHPQIIAIDCEWHGEYPTEPGSYLRTLQFSWKAGTGFCVAFRRQGGVESFSPSIESAIPELKRLLLSTPGQEVRIAGHHLRADLPWIVHLNKELGEGLIKQFGGPVDFKYARHSGGIDTMLAAHAVTEAPGKMGFKLEVLANNVLGLKRYDEHLQAWKKEYMAKQKLENDEALQGYGECPDDVLMGKPIPVSNLGLAGNAVGVKVAQSYAIWDVDATRRLVDAYLKPGGLLDKDQYGNRSWKPFRSSMEATAAFLEMEMTGLLIDRKRGEASTGAFMAASKRLTDELREELNWQEVWGESERKKGKIVITQEGFNPGSADQCKVMLFGDKTANVIDTKEAGKLKKVAPEGALRLNLTPIKTTSDKPWERVVARREEAFSSPSTDRQVLGILRAQLHDKGEKKKSKIVEKLRNVRFAAKVLQSMLRKPVLDKAGAPEQDDLGDWVITKGLLGSIHKDGRVRTHIFQTKETGRVSSARPPLQNLSKRRETDYKMILGAAYPHALRSMVMATPGYVLVEADYLGAELFMMAIQANDANMIEHCRRGMLKESDPNFYDIHSNIAVSAFKLKVPELKVVLDKEKDEWEWCHSLLKLNVGDPLPPNKTALKLAGVENLRTAAKTIAFGIPYGRGLEAIVLAIEEEGVKVTLQEAEAIRLAIFTAYPNLEGFLEGCAQRSKDPGWLVNHGGRYRRFQTTGVDDGGDAERQAKNFRIQSGVAECVNQAMKVLYNREDRRDEKGELKYRFVLQIHDAILFEVKIEYLDWFANDEDGVLKWGMKDSVEVFATDFNGKRIPGRPSYNMGIDITAQIYWGVDITPAEAEARGIPLKYAKEPKKKK